MRRCFQPCAVFKRRCVTDNLYIGTDVAQGEAMNRIMPPIAMTPTTQSTPIAGGANALQRAAQNAARLAGGAGGINAAQPVGQNNKAAPDFTSLLGNMLTEVSAAQAKSSDMNRRLQMGDPKATIEDTVLAMNTASVQFQMVVQVRNKLVQSYTDIMNMPV